MRRVPFALMVSTVIAGTLLPGCKAAIIRAPGVGEDAGPGGDIDDPEAYFEDEVEPILTRPEYNCSGCHEDAAASSGANFLEPGNYYASVKAWPGLITPGDGEGSLLPNRGEHRGPALMDADRAIVVRWIDAEGDVVLPFDAGPAIVPVETDPFALTEGEVRIPLASVGAPGSEVVMTTMRISSGANMLLTDVQFVAGAGGLSVSHPQFVIHDDSGELDPRDDRDVFADFEVRVPAGMSSPLAGSHVLAAFPDPGSLSIRFDSISNTVTP